MGEKKNRKDDEPLVYDINRLKQEFNEIRQQYEKLNFFKRWWYRSIIKRIEYDLFKAEYMSKIYEHDPRAYPLLKYIARRLSEARMLMSIMRDVCQIKQP